MNQGKIITLIPDHGYGFIKPLVAGEKDVFFHATSLADRYVFNALAIGQVVTYGVMLDPKNRPRAVNVTPVADEPHIDVANAAD